MLSNQLVEEQEETKTRELATRRTPFTEKELTMLDGLHKAETTDSRQPQRPLGDV